MTVLSAEVRQRVRESVARAVKARHATGDTLPALADLLGVDVATVRRWVEGRGYPTFTTSVRVCPLLGLDPATGRVVRS